jgi:pimeloyl-ACP methyl ester carboxylesterase
MPATDHRTAAQVTSLDGTPIAYWTSGGGPALVLVHGATADHSRWEPIVPLLEPHVTVVAVDRRGRGASGDATEYAIEREFEDVAAVVDASAKATGGPVHLLGHSYGGTCALGGATLTGNLATLTLYEPAWSAEAALTPPEFLDQLDALLAAGERERLLETMFRDLVGMPEHELAVFRTMPAWQRRIEAAHTLPRELRALTDDETFGPERIRSISAPTLMLLGGDSPTIAKAETEEIAAQLPDVRIAVLEGQQHVAIDLVPQRFSEAVLSFVGTT